MGKKKEHQIIDDIEMKHCPTCDNFKILIYFNRQASCWYKLSRMCKNCINQYKKNKRQNDENYKLNDKLYNEKYKQSGRRREVSQIRYKEKKTDIIKKCVEYNKFKYNNDPYFKVVSSIRSRVSKLIRQVNADKNNNFYEYLGCNKEEFINYFQAKFKEGMSWENHGEWHIDHIKPCASFNLLDDEEQKKCFHYTNLQPLWASENLSKGCKFIDDNIN
jgi:hypothetical protein